MIMKFVTAAATFLLAQFGYVALAADREQSAALELPFESTVVVIGREVTCPFAFKELNEIVKKATGRTFKSGNAAAHRIFLGRSPESERLLGAAFFEALAEEESRVFSRGNDLFLVGGAAGTLWAVYDFVEDNLGYHWYFECRDDLRAENEVVDRCEQVVFRGVPTRRTPGFDGFRISHNNEGYFRLFRLRQRSNREIHRFVPEYEFRYEGRTAGHGFDMYLPRDPKAPALQIKSLTPEFIRRLGDVFAAHPEYFSVNEAGRRSREMQLCLSNPATRQALLESLLRWIEMHGRGVYMVGSNDYHTGRYCFCADCVGKERQYGCAGGPLWDAVIWLCHELKRLGKDGVYVTSLAYRHQTQMCPGGVVFPDNFICDLAPVTWDRSPSETADETLPDGTLYNRMDNIRAWTKACPGGCSYWYYAEESRPEYNWGRQSRELRDIYDAGVRSVGMCGLEGGPEFKDMMHHLFFWTAFNPHGDARAEFKRMCVVKYGPAAEIVLAYADRMEDMRRRVVSRQPLGPAALPVLAFATKEELHELSSLLDGAVRRVAGTKWEENVSWTRISLDVEMFFRTGDAEAERRARAAAKSFFEKVDRRKLMRTSDMVMQRLDEMANYPLLKDDSLPAELGKYRKTSVTRILPAKSAPFAPYGRNVGDKMNSVPDAGAVCGFAMTDVLRDDYATGGSKDVRLGLYDANASKYLIPFHDVRFPDGFFRKDAYRLFCLGRSRYSASMAVVWTDAEGRQAFKGYSPVATKLLSRLFDSVELDQEYETWISVKVQGPKFFSDDNRENRVFVDQLFSVKIDR